MTDVSSPSSIQSIVISLVPVSLGLFGFFIQRAFKRVDADRDKHDERIGRLEQNAVCKEDWLRETGIARKRQDQILEKLSELDGRNQAGVEIGAAMAAALNRSEKK